MKLRNQILSLIVLLSGINVFASDIGSDQCKVEKIFLRSNNNNREFFLELNCLHRPIRGIAHLTFNKLTLPLIQEAFKSKTLLEIQFDFAQAYGPILKVNGRDYNFYDDSSTLPKLPVIALSLQAGETLQFSDSFMINVMKNANLNFQTQNGYSVSTDYNGVLIHSETNDSQDLIFPHNDILSEDTRSVTRLYDIIIKGELAKNIFEQLKAAGVQFQFSRWTSYGKLKESETFYGPNSRSIIEGCSKTTIVATQVITYSCTAVTEKLKITQ
jgi:hypothetical protein